MGFLDFDKIPIYALDISDLSFKFLRLTNSAGGIMIKHYGEGAIEKGIIENGNIKDQKRLEELLSDVFRSNNIKFVAVSLPEEKGFLEEIRVSGVVEEELPSALEFQIEEHVPLPAKDILFDYTVAEKGNDFFDLVINAFPGAVVESYLNVVGAAGALTVDVESELESFARALMPKDFTKTAMIMDWGQTRASFSVFKNRILRFASTVLVGGDTLDGAISKNFGISKKEAIKLKFKEDIAGLQTSPKFINAVLPVISVISEEIQKILDYWKNRPGTNSSIEHVFLSGGDSNLFGLPEYLQNELGISVSVANPWANINFPNKYLPPIKFKDSLRFSSVIGLSLKAMKKENIW